MALGGLGPRASWQLCVPQLPVHLLGSLRGLESPTPSRQRPWQAQRCCTPSHLPSTASAQPPGFPNSGGGGGRQPCWLPGPALASPVTRATAPPLEPLLGTPGRATVHPVFTERGQPGWGGQSPPVPCCPSRLQQGPSHPVVTCSLHRGHGGTWGSPQFSHRKAAVLGLLPSSGVRIPTLGGAGPPGSHTEGGEVAPALPGSDGQPPASCSSENYRSGGESPHPTGHPVHGKVQPQQGP